MKKKNLTIDNLQFYWRLINKPSKSGNTAPSFLPFVMDFDLKNGILIQKRNRKVLDYLDIVYKEEYNIGNMQNLNDRANLYSQDFLDFILDSIKKHKKNKLEILEIGCGGCMVLAELQDKGHMVTGIDPSPVSVSEGKRKKVKVIHDFFPSKKLRGKFDVIFHADVIEHVENPIKFLKQQYRSLNEGGLIVITTPDCTENIKHGDMSIILHQHLNYFDIESLESILKASGFVDVHVEKAKYGGSLNCVAFKNTKIKKVRYKKHTITYFNKFIRQNQKLTKKWVTYVQSLQSEGKSIGIYAPIRSLPYLAFLPDYSKIRFFDDTQAWHKKYFDGIPIRIENFNDLRENPVGNIIVMSPTFGALIEKKIKEEFGRKINTIKLTDFFE